MTIAKKTHYSHLKKYLAHTMQKVSSNLNANITLNINTIQDRFNIEDCDTSIQYWKINKGWN